jgi:hypothetical protein
MAADGRLVEYLVDLLESVDQPVVEVNGVSVALRPANPRPNDKSCYKKCLEEDVRNPGSYAKCIKKCRRKRGVSVVLDETAIE